MGTIKRINGVKIRVFESAPVEKPKVEKPKKKGNVKDVDKDKGED